MKAIQLNDEGYEPRTTLGGGEVRDLMPWEGEVAYVIEGDTLESPGRFGILYHLPEPCSRCGLEEEVEWMGTSLSAAFGDGVRILDITEDIPSLPVEWPGSLCVCG